MRFKEVGLDRGVASIERDLVAWLPWSADPLEAPVGPNVFTPSRLAESKRYRRKGLSTPSTPICSSYTHVFLPRDRYLSCSALEQAEKTMTYTRKPTVAGDTARFPRAVVDRAMTPIT